MGKRRVRPVLDRVKESMFDVLGDSVQGATVADLFAGVGSLGIEALSRGSERVDFFEKNAPTAEALKENLKRTHLQERARVYVSKLPGGLNAVSAAYGLIFVDPPFRIDYRLLEGVFLRIHGRGLLSEGGVIVYRHSPHSRYDPPEDRWELLNRRGYGDSVISFYGGILEDREAGRGCLEEED